MGVILGSVAFSIAVSVVAFIVFKVKKMAFIAEAVKGSTNIKKADGDNKDSPDSSR